MSEDGWKPNIAVDLDGVLARYDGWKGLEEIGDPIPGARNFMFRLSQFGRLIVHTTRANPDPFNDGEGRASPEELEALIAGWLEAHEIPYDEVFTGTGKPIAVAYIDDRAICCRPQVYMDETTGEDQPFSASIYNSVVREARKLARGEQ